MGIIGNPEHDVWWQRAKRWYAADRRPLFGSSAGARRHILHQQHVRLYTEPLGKPVQPVDAHAVFATLQSTDISPVDSSGVRQRFL